MRLPINAANVGLPTSGDGASDDKTPLADGLMIFAGGEPVYRNGVLVGAVGVSGDGTQQDDMVSYPRRSRTSNGLDGLANAPAGIRADQIHRWAGRRLSYVNLVRSRPSSIIARKNAWRRSEPIRCGRARCWRRRRR